MAKLIIEDHPLWSRFWSKVDRSSECWTWTAGVDRNGYGRFAVKHGVLRGAHDVAFQMVHGPRHRKMDLDHLCRNAACVNPDHLELVTHRENVRRGAAGSHQGNVREFCKSGRHRLETSSQVRPSGKRYCKECANEGRRGRRG